MALLRAALRPLARAGASRTTLPLQKAPMQFQGAQLGTRSITFGSQAEWWEKMRADGDKMGHTRGWKIMMVTFCLLFTYDNLYDSSTMNTQIFAYIFGPNSFL